jgi:hypothetical protein
MQVITVASVHAFSALIWAAGNCIQPERKKMLTLLIDASLQNLAVLTKAAFNGLNMLATRDHRRERQRSVAASLKPRITGYITYDITDRLPTTISALSVMPGISWVCLGRLCSSFILTRVRPT